MNFLFDNKELFAIEIFDGETYFSGFFERDYEATNG
jgi:hypothetical protein